VLEEIRRTGYPLEIQTTGIFREHSWKTFDHTYYIDKDENKGREIDVFAMKTFTAEHPKKRLRLDIGLAVEIKKTDSSPWVILRSLRGENDSLGALFDTVMIGMHGQEIWFDELYANHPVAKFERWGRVAYQAFRKKGGDGLEAKSVTSTTFSAFVSCFKASAELSAFHKNYANQPLREGDGKKAYRIGLTHGVIVVSGNLFSAVVSKDFQVRVAAEKYVPYVFNYASEKYGYKKMLMDVITFDALPGYITDYEAWATERVKWCLDQL
jgi:hypothetical protein